MDNSRGSIIRIVASLYVGYLGIKIIIGQMNGTEEHNTVALIFAVGFLLFAAFFLFTTISKMKSEHDSGHTEETSPSAEEADEAKTADEADTDEAETAAEADTDEDTRNDEAGK